MDRGSTACTDGVLQTALHDVATNTTTTHYDVHKDKKSRTAASADAKQQLSETKLLIGHHGAFGKAVGTVGETGKCRDIEIMRDLTSVNQQSGSEWFTLSLCLQEAGMPAAEFDAIPTANCCAIARAMTKRVKAVNPAQILRISLHTCTLTV